MKVYLLEAVDPEDRKLRQRKLLDKSAKLHAGSRLALQHGNKHQGEQLFVKSMRARYIAQRNKPMQAAYRSAVHSDRPPQGVSGSMPASKGTDIENRKLRIKGLLQHAKKLKVASKLAKPGSPVASAKLGARAAYTASMAKAYKVGGKAKIKWKNTDRDSQRIYAAKPGTAAAKSAAPTGEKKVRHIAKEMSFSGMKPFLKKGSKIDPVSRQNRLAKVLHLADKAKAAHSGWMKGDHNVQGIQGKPKFDKRDGRTQKTALDHRLDTKRAHLIVAKAISKPQHRAGIKKALQAIQQGKAYTPGSNKTKNRLKNPLAKFGHRVESTKTS